MSVSLNEFQLSMKGYGDIKDITSQVSSAVSKSQILDGLATVCVAGSTASITTIEYESGVVEDLKEAIERMAPSNIRYRHDARWGDGNGFAHVRAAMIGSSLTVPVSSGRLILGTWQQIVLLDFDNRPRNRRVYVQIVGE